MSAVERPSNGIPLWIIGWFILDAVLALTPPLHWVATGDTRVLGVPAVVRQPGHPGPLAGEELAAPAWLAVVAAATVPADADAIADAVARQFEAHLTAVFVTPLPDEPLAYEPTVVAGVWAELLGRAREEAAMDAIRRKFGADAIAFGRTLTANMRRESAKRKGS